jgi:hypothetical protein
MSNHQDLSDLQARRNEKRDEAADLLAVAGLNAEQIGSVLDTLTTKAGSHRMIAFLQADADVRVLAEIIASKEA